MKKLISLILTIAMIFMSVSVFAAFEDIDETTLSWAGEAISDLTEKGIINGYPDGSFRPDGMVTRAEFAKMLTLSFDSEASDKSFTDINGHWAEEYVNSAASLMYNPDESFGPDSNAARADIAYAVSKALDLSLTDETIADKFSDFELVEDEMKLTVAAAIENGIIVGYEDSTLRPADSVTRAEAAVIIYRAMMLEKSEEAAPDENIPEEIVPGEPSEEEDKTPSKDHIYTLYPGQDLLLVESITRTTLESDGEDAFRIVYRIANEEEKYSSVLPYDVEVQGVRSSLEQVCPGDVLIMNTAFHGYIDYLHVVASLGESTPSFNSPYSGIGDYTASYGMVTAVKESGRAIVVTLKNGEETEDVYILNSTYVNLFSSWLKNEKWSLGDTADIDPEKGDIYVFIRYTDGASTDVVVNAVRK